MRSCIVRATRRQTRSYHSTSTCICPAQSHAEAILALGVIEREAGARGRLIEACAPSVEAASLVVRSALEHSMQVREWSCA